VCLILLAKNVLPGRPWLLLGNRDEFHLRPTAPAEPWHESPDVIGGRDLEAGGSWLAVHDSGRFAAVTNVRSAQARRGIRSRGELVAAFVRDNADVTAYASVTAAERDQYGPFNLIVGDRHVSACASSLRSEAWPLESGVHVLSNGAPGVDWPKVRRLRERFAECAAGVGATEIQSPRDNSRAAIFDDALLDLLGDTTQPGDDDLPHTGVSQELERMLAPIFIRGSDYGTRASTLAYARNEGGVVLHERRFGPGGIPAGESRIEG